MRRLVSVVLFLLCLMFVYGQDIIVTKDAQKIEAKILEVSKNSIKYKEYNDLDGPVFILETSYINTILYSSGRVSLYGDVNPETESQKEQKQEDVAVTVTLEEDTVHIAYSLEEYSESTLPKLEYKKVHVPGKKHKKYRYVSTDGNLVLTSNQFKNLLELYCPQAWSYQKKANTFLVLECFSLLFGLVPVLVFGILSINYSAKVLPTYNNMCAGTSVTLIPKLQTFTNDALQLNLTPQ